MNDTPFQVFLNLVEFDRNIVAINNEIESLENDIQLLNQQEQERLDRLKQVQQRLHNAHKIVDEQELVMKELDDKIREKKKQMDEISDVRAYRSFKTEIDTLNKQQVDQETAVMQAWNTVETAQKDVADQQAKAKEEEAAYKKEKEEKEHKLKELQQKYQELEKQRTTKTTAVPEEWLETYEHMRGRVSDPVVPVDRGSCSACFYSIPNQDLIRLKRRALLQCKGCFRFLYDETAQQAEEQ